jgi:hypothetical protein
MITLNQNEHARYDVRDTRRDKRGGSSVDVEIESRHNSNFGVTCHQRTTVRQTGTKTSVLLLLPRVMCDQWTPPAIQSQESCWAHGNQNAGTTSTVRLLRLSRLLLRLSTSATTTTAATASCYCYHYCDYNDCDYDCYPCDYYEY